MFVPPSSVGLRYVGFRRTLATLFSSGGKFITAGNVVTDGITFPEYRPYYGGVLGWSGTILVPAIVPSFVPSSLPFISS